MQPSAPRVQLAIECSARLGTVAIGVGQLPDALLPAAGADPRQPRKGAELMPAIDALFRARGVQPAELKRVFVSIGPGSFTGLRVAIATAKLLAETLGCELVAVPTLNALACNITRPGAAVLAALNLKGSTVYAGCFQIGAEGLPVPLAPAGLTTLPELLARCPRPLLVLGDPLPAPEGGWPRGVEHLSGEESTPNAHAVYRWGVARGEPIEADALLPLYARPPEAVELWNRRHSEPAARP